VLSGLLLIERDPKMSDRKRSHLTATSAPEPAPLCAPPFIEQMSMLGVQMMQANLAAARSVFDAWRSMVRQQQDALVDALDTQVREAVPLDQGGLTPTLAKPDDETYVAPHDAHERNRHGALDAFA
jgi:hypothetical protein